MPHQRRLTLLCYATTDYEPQQRAVLRRAARVGFTHCLPWKRSMLERTVRPGDFLVFSRRIANETRKQLRRLRN